MVRSRKHLSAIIALAALFAVTDLLLIADSADARRRRGGGHSRSHKSSSKASKAAPKAEPADDPRTKWAGVSFHKRAPGSKPYTETAVSANPRREMKMRMQEIAKEREEFKKKAAAMRKKEKLAYAELNQISHQLDQTRGKLKVQTRQLQSTVSAINTTSTKITTTRSSEHSHLKAASGRIKEIYQGHRLRFIEMIFAVDSLQQLLDHMYYQERLAAQDSKLLDMIRARREALEANKSRLDLQKDKLGSLVEDIKKTALEIAQKKLSQEQVAERLRTQRAFYEQAEHELANQSRTLETQILAMESHSETSGPMQKGTGSMAMPLRAKVTSPFGWRRHPIFGRRKFHTGVDLAGPSRSPIRASDSGHVLFTGWYGGYGKVVIVSHGNSLSTLYAHLSSVAVNKGANVSKGDVIGYEGSTGFSTGPHLHFEVRVNGKPNNPLGYVR